MSYQNDDSPKESRAEGLERVQTQASIMIPPELFEQLYLSPRNPVKGTLRQTFGNPTPIGQCQHTFVFCLWAHICLALGGFLLCTTPASMALLGWQGAGGFGAAANV